MRVASHAFEQYRRTAELAPREREHTQTQAHARTTTTSIGFSLGKFGVRYESQSTRLDPSLSRDVREKKRQQRAFQAESEVETLRAAVGAQAAAFREQQTARSVGEQPSPGPGLVRRALNAYAMSTEDPMPLPGNMLASVV